VNIGVAVIPVFSAVRLPYPIHGCLASPIVQIRVPSVNNAIGLKLLRVFRPFGPLTVRAWHCASHVRMGSHYPQSAMLAKIRVREFCNTADFLVLIVGNTCFCSA